MFRTSRQNVHEVRPFPNCHVQDNRRKPEESILYTLPAHLDNPRMPPNSPRLPQRELDLLQGWIAGGLSEKASGSIETGPALRAVRPRRGLAMRGAGIPAERKEPTEKPEKRTAAVASAPTGRIPVPRSSSSPPALADPVTALAVSPSGSLVAVSGHHQLRVCRGTDLTQVSAFPFPEGAIFALRFSRDGLLILAAGGTGALSGKVVAFDVTTGERRFEAGDETDVVLAADLSPDGRLLAFGGPNRVVRLYDTVQRRQTAELTQHTDNGVYSCIEPLSGEAVRTARATGLTYCSPIAVGNCVYLFEDAGGCTIIENGPRGHETPR